MTDKKDNIIATASALMERQGYFGTGLNEIIEESGAPKGSLYYYFPDGKDQITEEALRRIGEEVEANIRTTIERAEGPADAVSALAEVIAERVEASDFAAGGPLTTVALETAAKNEQLRKACDDIYDSWRIPFSEALRGAGLTEQRAQSLSYMILSALEGAIVLSRTSRSIEPLEAMAEEMSNLIGAAQQ